MTTLAERLRARRESLHLTQEQVAAASGLCASTVQKLEAGRESPRLKTLQRIAATLGVSMDELVDTKEPTP